jgi:hypothetical protein
LVLGNFLHNKENEDYLTASSKLPVLKSTLVFTDEVNKISGVSTFEKKDNVIMFIFNNNIYIQQKAAEIPKLIPYNNNINNEQPQQPQDISPIMSPIDINHNNSSSNGSSSNNYTPTTTINSTDDNNNRLDPKLGGINNDKISFIRASNIWVTDFDGNELQLTFSNEETIKCGIAEYMMQEEFHRFTGYYWCPNQNKILYLETSEKDVELVIISPNNQQQQQQESIRYPRAGKSNAKSRIKIVEFINNNDNIVTHTQLWDENDLNQQFPWMEYIVRFGWFSDGER